jgi:hypothetical protein
MGLRNVLDGTLAVAALLLALAWPAVGGADGPRTRAADFIGLWEGVDEDGSLAQRAITCEEDRTCRVLGAEQFFSLCDDHGGRGVIKGSGTIEGGVFSVPDFTLTCADGTAFTAATVFSRDRRNGTLIEDTEGAPATLTLHRLSPRVGSGR